MVYEQKGSRRPNVTPPPFFSESDIFGRDQMRHLRKLRNRQEFKSFTRTGTKGQNVFRMPLIHSSTSNAKSVTRALARHRQLINRLGHTGICWRIQRPRFLALYAHNYRVGR